jgi:hypothetical protein
MTKLFFDGWAVMDDIEKEIKKVAKTSEEKEELWHLVDDMVHHKVLESILDKLPEASHVEFMGKYHERPFDSEIVKYLKEKIGENVEEIIKTEVGSLAIELLDEIRGKEGAPQKHSEKKE